MRNVRAQADSVLDGETGRYFSALVEHGFVHIPRLVEPGLLAQIQAGVRRAIAEAPFGLDERTLAPETETSRTGLGEGVDVYPIFQLPYESMKILPGHPLLKKLMQVLLGDDYYLDRSIIRKARAGSPRFYYHKDQHGDLGIMVLVEDLGPDEGNTTFIPGTHLGRPPTLFRVRNINVKHPAEVQMIGKAGDAYLFSRDIDHSRAPNTAGRDTVQLLYTFINKNTRPMAHSRKMLLPEHLSNLPPDVCWMLRAYDGDEFGTDGTLVDRFVYQSGFSSAGAGDYDIRNDLVRDFLYTIRHISGSRHRNERGEYYRNISRLNEEQSGGGLEYLRSADPALLLRNLALQILRRSAFGRRAVSCISNYRRRTTLAKDSRPYG